MSANPDEDPAKRRFFLLSGLRLGGAAFATLGLLVFTGKLALDLPREIGLAFLAVGLADFLFVPLWLSRRWKSPRQ